MTQDAHFAVFVVCAVVALAALAAHRSRFPLRHAADVADAIAQGRLDVDIAQDGWPPARPLMAALRRLRELQRANHVRILSLTADQAQAHVIRRQKERMEAALDHMSQGLCLFSPDGTLAGSNVRFGEMFTQVPDGAEFEAVLRRAGLEEALGRLQDAGAVIVEHEDGRLIAVCRRQVAGGGWVITCEDVTERENAETRLAHMARHDQLTGLPNRLMLYEHLVPALARARRGGSAAVLYLDLDRFKPVNDVLGQSVGDGLLRAVAQRLRDCTRETDLVARLGNDEFVILQEGASQPGEASALAERLIATMTAPFMVDGHRVMIGASIGIALSLDGVTRADALLKCADLALQRCKAEGGARFHFFEEVMDAQMQLRRSLELDLRGAIAAGQFEVFYQPLMSVAGGICGFEALLRWNHPDHGLVSPGVFIPLAEDTGLIIDLGDWVLRQACAEAASWPGELKVAVNLSPKQFHSRHLADSVADALSISGLPPHRLEVEVTESVLLQNDDAVLETLHSIRGMGVRIAMDDFGTGYSSLGYLSRFPFDKLKIDQSFVRGMTDSRDCLAIVRAVIGLGRSLGMAVNAEGVETPEQRDALRAEGCPELQGFLFSRPRPAGAIPGMLAELGRAGPAAERAKPLAA